MKKFRWVFFFAALMVLTLPIFVVPACQLIFGSSSVQDERIELPRADEGAWAAGSRTSTFAVGLFGEARKGTESDNLILSPGSAMFSMVMMLDGASGTTQEELSRLLRLPHDDLSDTARSFSSLHRVLADRKDVEMRLANSAWIRTGFEPNPEYVSTLRDSYGALVKSGSFGPATAAEMNEWVSEATKGRVPTIAPPGAADVLLLANAACFKGQWAVKFDPSATNPRDFHLADGTKKSVPFMRSTARARLVHREGGVVCVNVPFRHYGFVFRAFMPEDGSSLEELADKLRTGPLREVVLETKTIDWLKADLAMPRFTIRSRLNLVAAIKAMGAESLFAPDTAEFERMRREGDATPLFVTGIDQESFVEVNEEGAEAVSVTRVGIGCSAQDNRPPDAPVVLDRPFIFLIADTRTDAIIFMGQVTDPSK